MFFMFCELNHFIIFKAKRRKRDATETTNTITNVLIGEERDCKGTTEKYCNGYLKPGKEYKYVTFVNMTSLKNNCLC